MYHIVKPFSKQMLFLLKCPPVHEKIFSCKSYGTLISAQPTWSRVVVYIHHTLHLHRASGWQSVALSTGNMSIKRAFEINTFSCEKSQFSKTSAHVNNTEKSQSAWKPFMIFYEKYRMTHCLWIQKWKKKEKKMRIWVHFLMKCALIYIEAQGQRRIWISSEVTLKRVHTLAAENKQA